MLILSIRSDQPTAEIGLHSPSQQMAYHSWPAGRQLAAGLLQEIKNLLAESGHDWPDLGGVVVYGGPGSFTGLRIGTAVANALAAGLAIPAVGTASENWIKQGKQRLLSGQAEAVILPRYGRPPHITKPKH